MNTPRRNALILAGGVAVASLSVVSYQVGQRNADGGAPASSAAPTAGAKPLYWYDPMVPNQRFDHPGKSPFMDMQLVPKMADGGDPGAGAASGVRVDPGVVQNLGIRTAEVRRGQLGEALSTTGVVQFNERDIAIVQSRAAGFVQRVYRRAPGDVVAAGAPIADLLIPEWGGAQTEFLAVKRTANPALTAASRQRLRLLGMTESLISTVERSGRLHATVTVATPISGVIQKLEVRPGMTVTAGQNLAEINGLGTVWVNAAIPEAQAGRARTGQTVIVTFDAFPGEAFPGRVHTVLPQVAGESRTLQARIELPNRSGRLRPGLFAQVAFQGGAESVLLIPSEALIRTGRRTIVMVAGQKGRFEPVEVQVGRESGDQTEVRAGLNAGDRVVVSGQFLLDSEASLSGLNPRPLGAMMSAASPAQRGGASQPAGAKPKAPAMAFTQGRVESASPSSITLSHDPVAAVGWPAMTMTFRVLDPGLTRGVKAGDRVRFGFDQPAAGPTVRMIDSAGAPSR